MERFSKEYIVISIYDGTCFDRNDFYSMEWGNYSGATIFLWTKMSANAAQHFTWLNNDEECTVIGFEYLCQCYT